MAVLQERTSLIGSRVDVAAGIIRGVKILGPTSRNGRSYTADALRRAAGLYEGKVVNVDHLRSPHDRRSYADRIGRLEDVAVRSDGLYGDLHYNPKHPLAEQLAWDAEHAPGNVGLSHDATGRTIRRDGRDVVEEIESVRSVDLVADPATTSGLFEGYDDDDLLDEEEIAVDLYADRPEDLRADVAAIRESARPAYEGFRRWHDEAATGPVTAAVCSIQEDGGHAGGGPADDPSILDAVRRWQD